METADKRAKPTNIHLHKKRTEKWWALWYIWIYQNNLLLTMWHHRHNGDWKQLPTCCLCGVDSDAIYANKSSEIITIWIHCQNNYSQFNQYIKQMRECTKKAMMRAMHRDAEQSQTILFILSAREMTYVYICLSFIQYYLTHKAAFWLAFKFISIEVQTDIRKEV